MHSFTDLHAWQKGILLLQEVYKISGKFPASERYEMSKQIRRASGSILANIAEGFSKRTHPDKANKYTIARSECSEVAAFLYAAIALKFVSADEAKRALWLTEETGKLLSGLIHSHILKIPQ